jgi:hypothetical protein
MPEPSVPQHAVAELSFTSSHAYADPFNEITLDVAFTSPDGRTVTVPAFWAGEQTWKARYASPQTGHHAYRTICSDTGNADLHNQAGTLAVTDASGASPLQRRGHIRQAADHRHLEHTDGSPFFWLGDTWWMGFTRRLDWPDGFKELTADRVAKGFTVVQIVAGLYPDMEPFDERGANEAGFPWERDFSRINPAYFDAADHKVAYMVLAGLMPCIVGEWGYFMDFAGQDVLRRHWRYIVARWGAYPVIWCVAGEALMNYYLLHFDSQEEAARHTAQLREQWAGLARYIRGLDAFGNPIGIHPTQFGHEQVSDPTVLDVDMLQTGHSGYPTLADTVTALEKALAHEPKLPVLVDEVNYEGIMESSREEMQRFLFWTSMLSGACGHTYGANGLWQVNTHEVPYGPSPHGSSWGDTPWQDAYQLPGSKQLGLGKKLLECYPWAQFEPHPEWIEPHQTPENRQNSYAAGIPGQVRVIFIPAQASWQAWAGRLAVVDLEPGVAYRARYCDPKTGREYDLGAVSQAQPGKYIVPKPPIFQDWVLVVERVG